MKCNQSRPGFELVSPCPFPTTIMTTPSDLMEGYSTFPKIPVLLELYHQIVKCHTSDTYWWGSTPLQRCSQCVLLHQLTGLGRKGFSTEIQILTKNKNQIEVEQHGIYYFVFIKFGTKYFKISCSLSTLSINNMYYFNYSFF